METTRLLVRRLRDSDPRWDYADFRDGHGLPLTRAGVLKPACALDSYVCEEACEGCDGVCAIEPIPGSESTTYAWRCKLSGEMHNLPSDKAVVWRLDAQTLAQRVSTAFVCEGAKHDGDGIWLLGATGQKGLRKRTVVLVLKLDAATAERIARLNLGTGFLLLAGIVEYEFADEQMRKRVYSFENTLRFSGDGELQVLSETILAQLGAPLAPKTRGARSDWTDREKKVANHLKDIAFAILHLKNYDEKIKELRKVTGASLAAELGFPPSKLSTMLNLKGKNPNASPIPQFWFEICTDETHYFLFEEIVKEAKQDCSTAKADVLYDKFHKQMALRRARLTAM